MKQYKYIIGLCFGLILAATLGFSVAGAQTATIPQYTFTRDLTVGSTGVDVQVLQRYLNARGFLVATVGAGSPGLETMYFGPLTRSAVSRYQAANGISPTAGYFGPITRNHVNVYIATHQSSGNNNNNNNNNDDELSGGDGDFKDFDVLGSPSSENVDEGEEVQVLGFEFEADDSDLRLERLDVQVTGDGNTERPWRYIDSVTLFDEDDDEVATIDASDEDAWDEQDDDQYEITLDDLDEIVREGDTVKFYIAVEAKDSLDSDDLPVDFRIFISDDGLRAVNAEDINVYEGNEDDDKTFTIDEAESGDLDITVRNADNEDTVVEVDDNNETNDVVLYTAELDSQNGDNDIEEVTVDIASLDATVLSDMVSTLYLFIDGDEVGSESVDSATTDSVTFDDIDVTLNEDDEVDLVVKADIAEQEGNYDNGDGVQVTGISIDFVDENDDDQTVTDTTDGGEVTFGATGINAELSGTPTAEVTYGQFSGDNDRGVFTIKFEVTAFGEDDVYIGGEDSTDASNEGVNYTLTNPGDAVITSAELTSTAEQGDNDTFIVNSGDTETFTFTVQIQDADPGDPDVAQRLNITGIKWDIDDDSTPDNTYTSNLDDFETPSRTL